MRKLPIILALSALVLTVQPARAEDAAPGAGAPPVAGQERGQMREGFRHHRGEMLQRLDKDGNGSVSREEFMAGAAERFAKMDRNGDGVLTKDDMPQRPEGGGGQFRGQQGADGPGAGDQPPPPPAE